MPKLPKSETQKRYDRLRFLVAGKLKLYRMPVTDLAIRAHMCKTALNYKLNDPGLFRVIELERIMEALHFTKDERAQVLM